MNDTKQFQLTKSEASVHAKDKFPRSLVAGSMAAVVLCGCYVMPVGEDKRGNAVYAYSPVPFQVDKKPAGPVPQALDVRLYPMNAIANESGVLAGQVTNMMTGKGRFTFNYQGATLVGEATRMANDARSGVANAYGPNGLFARCEYQMSSPSMGAGTCSFSDNAMYQVHIGN